MPASLAPAVTSDLALANRLATSRRLAAANPGNCWPSDDRQGYTSSLAASDLLELGWTEVADIDGGFEAWRDAGLPTVDGGRPADVS